MVTTSKEQSTCRLSTSRVIECKGLAERQVVYVIEKRNWFCCCTGCDERVGDESDREQHSGLEMDSKPLSELGNGIYRIAYDSYTTQDIHGYDIAEAG